MNPIRTAVCVSFICGSVLAAEKPASAVVIEVSPPLPSGRGMGTMIYNATKKEEAFLAKMTEKKVDLDWNAKLPKPANVSDEEWAKTLAEEEKEKAKSDAIPNSQYELAAQAGSYVGWFGIVRKITHEDGKTSLLIEHKYFDGLTDLDLQVVSIYGAGDFKAVTAGHEIVPLLGLVRIFGMVSKDKDGVAVVTPEYIRVWDWGRFTFMDYGRDKTNPEWVKLRKVDGSRIYTHRIDEKFYEDRLGKRE